jgi:hypothetical protein
MRQVKKIDNSLPVEQGILFDFIHSLFFIDDGFLSVVHGITCIFLAFYLI